MASSSSSSTTTSHLIFILLGFLSLSISAAARPFFISSYSVSVRRHFSAGTLTTFKQITSLDVLENTDDYFDNLSFSADTAVIELRESQIQAPFGFSSRNFSSLHDRSKDIVSVVLALLFGVAGGAFTAIGLYLIWSVLSERYCYRDSYGDEEEIDSPKKMGYEKIPEFRSAQAIAEESV